MSSAARTNLTSQNVSINEYDILGEGSFRIAYAGTYIGGNRNNQEAVCKCFKSHCRVLENEFFLSDFEVTDRAISIAEDWNHICPNKKEILITKGDVMQIGGTKYLVEPLIRNFTKFTSNSGWIASESELGWSVLAMEAFSHYSYHRTGGQLIICDLQGRYRNDRYNANRCRFELTDVAICSRNCRYGPTDLGEKGIESFFRNHTCNKFCNHDGRWARPRNPRRWFELTKHTSMMNSSSNDLLKVSNPVRFTATLQPIYDNYYDDSDSDDSW